MVEPERLEGALEPVVDVVAEEQAPYKVDSRADAVADGFVGVALISRPELPWGINHFGFEVEDVPAIEEATQTKAVSNTFGAVAESWIRDPEGNRVDISEHGWPI